MKPELQRIAIAEACGYVFPSKDTELGSMLWWWFEDGGKGEQKDVPDYLNDLNAMHAAEKKLNSEQRIDYLNILADMWPFKGDHFDHGFIAAITATAAQRAQAFLRAIGKWEDS